MAGKRTSSKQVSFEDSETVGSEEANIDDGPRARPSMVRLLRKLSRSWRGGTDKISYTSRYHRLPRRLDRDYKVHQTLLGCGVSGSVYSASARSAISCCSCFEWGHRDQHQTFAVKTLSLLDVPLDQRELLASELQVFLTMDHPKVVRLLDIYESESSLHLVMERLRGGDVFDRLIDCEDFSEGAAAKAMRQMLLALKYLHDLNIVHKDIKPNNFLYEDALNDDLKLIDFGFSKLLFGADAQKHKICGTGSYLAPELMFSECTTKCDMWSLGVTSYLLQSGSLPFSGNNDVELASSILSGEYSMCSDIWESVSEDGKDFTRSLLQTEPAKRLSASEAIRHPWMQPRDSVRFSRRISGSLAAGLLRFSRTARFKRCCFAMVAQTMSGKDYKRARDVFVQVDTDNSGRVSLAVLRTLLVDNFDVQEEEVVQIFNALAHHDETIHYSDFLAATVAARQDLDDETLRSAFNKFDIDGTGYITEEDVARVLGETDVKNLLQDTKLNKTGRLGYSEFLEYLRPSQESPSRKSSRPSFHLND